MDEEKSGYNKCICCLCLRCPWFEEHSVSTSTNKSKISTSKENTNVRFLDPVEEVPLKTEGSNSMSEIDDELDDETKKAENRVPELNEVKQIEDVKDDPSDRQPDKNENKNKGDEFFHKHAEDEMKPLELKCNEFPPNKNENKENRTSDNEFAIYSSSQKDNKVANNNDDKNTIIGEKVEFEENQSIDSNVGKYATNNKSDTAVGEQKSRQTEISCQSFKGDISNNNINNKNKRGEVDGKSIITLSINKSISDNNATLSENSKDDCKETDTSKKGGGIHDLGSQKEPNEDKNYNNSYDKGKPGYVDELKPIVNTLSDGKDSSERKPNKDSVEMPADVETKNEQNHGRKEDKNYDFEATNKPGDGIQQLNSAENLKSKLQKAKRNFNSLFPSKKP